VLAPFRNRALVSRPQASTEDDEVMRLPSTTVQRPGFTLVELLVVIAIIAILAALLSSAVLKAMLEGPRLQTRSDLTQLSDALGTFNSKFSLRYYPPSKLKLCSLKSLYDTTKQLDNDSIAYLQSMFPRMADTWSGTINNSFGNKNGIMWGHDNTAVNGVTLTGDQCLVFFLGGIQTTSSTPGCLGFSTNPNDPGAAGGDRIGPFFDFKATRLVAGANGFFSYNDVWGSPLLYFSSYKTRNGYNRYAGAPMNLGSDCTQASPYVGTNGIYYNSDTFQIVSAGADRTFGGGGTWDMGSASPVTAGGMDDMTNFYSGLMGVPAN
jgi:prepilin-type N-terminal cleavage/methylation domain-containing protein